MRKNRILLTLSVLLTILALNGSPARGAASARINISPWGFAHPPTKMDIIVHLERDVHNRNAKIIVNSDGFYSESDIPLDGDKAPFLIRRELQLTKPGYYQAFLELQQWTGSSWKVQEFHSEVLQLVD